MVFIYDDNAYSYDDLLKAISGSGTYYPLYRTKELFPFFANMIKALAAGMPLTLVDSDINASEIDGVEESDINVEQSFSPKTYQSMDDVVAALQQSRSEITIFTSGTTGQPKKVVHSISTLTRNVRLGE